MSTLHDLTAAIGGRWLSRPSACEPANVSVGPAVIDSRLAGPGSVFWAMKGVREDGADFIAGAFSRGAAAAVVGRPVEVREPGWILQVDDPPRALQQWAAWKRRQFAGTVIAVTGSVGKTTTRQMIHTVLTQRLSGTASPRNYNNPLGVALSLSAIEPDHDYVVLELGASRRGEIAALAELCAPKVGVITQVGDVHLGGFGSRRAVAETKAELLAALPPNGQAVLGDDPWLRSVAAGCRAEITWVGTATDCDLVALEVQSGNGRLSFQLRGTPFCVPVWGRHHLTAALAAVAVGRMLGFDLAAMAAALAEFRSVPQRCEVLEVRGATIINDTYNSNPSAMQAALELLREFDTPGRRIVVCGDMAELGKQSAALHWQLGKQIVAVGGADLLVAVGQFARHVTAGARAAGMSPPRAIGCERIEQALPYLGQAILPGDVVLVKGSRMMAMERVVEALVRYPQRRSA